MPVYQVFSPDNLLSDEQRQQIVDEITRIHTSNTGAPALFVNVVFTDLPAGRVFSAGKPSRLSLIIGNIREGRDIEVRQTMLRQLSAMWVEITGAPETEVLLAIQETDPLAAMELGLLFPPAGQEAAWFAKHQDKLAALGISGG
ncbi:tautomerase family protein [Amycolatopsis sp. NBC_01480]|uniref:tautomerase family protein n=1 Tax=Amycolatopsis sp. NBC_01480 TaxID=2903562 RepID=UPI002E2B8D88|nr:tautomerase family protein [Amycolatopsis sp. NBC_01480]